MTDVAWSIPNVRPEVTSVAGCEGPSLPLEAVDRLSSSRVIRAEIQFRCADAPTANPEKYDDELVDAYVFVDNVDALLR